MSDSSERFGERLRQLRGELGYSQEDFAPLLGYGKHALGRRERGEVASLPNETTVNSWADALGLERPNLRARLFDGLEGGHSADGTVARIRPHLPQELNQFIAAARGKFWVWQTWIPQTDVQFADSLAAAVQAGTEVRLLLMDPLAPATIDRARRLAYHPTELTNWMRGLIGNLRRAGVQPPSSAIRLTDVVPLAQIYATERKVFIGWFFPDKASTVMPQIEVAHSASVAGALLGLFDREWARLPEPKLSQYET